MAILLALAGCSSGGDGGSQGGVGGGGVDKTAPVSTITFPTGGEVLSGTVNVTWDTVDENPGVVEIAVSNKGSSAYTVIESSLIDTGSYELDTVLLSQQFNPAETDTYRIRITPSDIPSNTGPAAETADFTIDNTAPDITIVPKNNPFLAGVARFNWTTSQDLTATTVDISLSTGNGSAIDAVLADGAPNNNFFDWDTTQFDDGGNYVLTVIARDDGGNESEPISFTGLTVDNTPPDVVNPQLTADNVTPGSVHISWLSAEDVITSDPTVFEYRVYRSNADNINTFQSAESNGIPVNDWTQNITDLDVNALNSAQIYHWNVFVRDLANNVSSYDALLQGTTAAGVLDSSFSDDGVVVIDDIAGGSSADEGYDAAIDRDGNIVTVGFSVNGNTVPSVDAVILRHTDAGILDSTFTGGVVVSDNAAGGNGYDEATAVNIDDKDRVVVTGRSNNGTDSDMVIWRLTPVGELDPTFDELEADGIVDYPSASGDDEGFDVVVDASNRILVTGKINNGTNDDMALWRYTENGTLDTSFGSGGVVIHPGIPGKDDDDVGNALVLKPTGNALDPYEIFVAGSSGSGANMDMVIWRFDSTGAPITGDSNGIFSTVPDVLTAVEDGLNDIVVDDAGRLVVTGSRATDNVDMITLRFLDTGIVDPDFGNNGIVEGVGGGSLSDVHGYALELDNAGNILVAGDTFNAFDSDMVIWRFDASGNPDTSFGDSGIVTGSDAITTNVDEVGMAVKVDQQGRIIVTGRASNTFNYDMVIWRYK